MNVKERMKLIVDQAFESYKYFPENYQEKDGKTNSLAIKNRYVIQNSKKIKRYKLNVTTSFHQNFTKIIPYS